MLFQSKNYQYMEQVASQCYGGFLRQLLQETTGRLEQGCGTISDAYIHYYYKLQVTSYKFEHHTKFGCYFSYCVRARRRSQKFGDAGALPPWEEYVADPLETRSSPHASYQIWSL